MLYNIWLGMVIFGTILLLVSLILIFVLKIPDLLDELSGRKAKRQIKRLKELNIGTGALEGIATEDVYSALPSGTLLSEEVKIVETVKPSPPTKGKSKIITEPILDDVDIPTSNMEEQEATGFMESNEDEGATTFIDDNDVTGILQEISEYCENRKVVQIIEEQSSL